MAFFWGQNVAKTVWRSGSARSRCGSFLQRSLRSPKPFSCFTEGGKEGREERMGREREWKEQAMGREKRGDGKGRQGKRRKKGKGRENMRGEMGGKEVVRLIFFRTWLRHCLQTDLRTDRRTDKQTDDRIQSANSRSYCIAVHRLKMVHHLKCIVTLSMTAFVTNIHIRLKIYCNASVRILIIIVQYFMKLLRSY